MTTFNAWGHELSQGQLAVSAKREDVLELVIARRNHTCNDCKGQIEKGSLHGSINIPFISRHVCVDCLRNKESFEFAKTQTWKA